MIRRISVLILAIALMACSLTALADGDRSSPNAVSLAKAKITYATTSGIYDGNQKDFTKDIVVTLNKVRLTCGVDYVITCTDANGNVIKGAITAGSDARKYKVKYTIEGIGHYKGLITKSASYTIKKATQTTTIDNDAVESATDNKLYTTEAVYAGDLISGTKTVPLGLTTDGDGVLLSSNKKFAVDADGNITVAKGVKAGTYKIYVYAKAGTNYNASARTYVYVKVLKDDQTVKVSQNSYTAESVNGKTTANQTFKLDSVAAENGKNLPAGSLYWKSSYKYISYNAKTGLITVKKGAKDGTYTLTVYAKSTNYLNQSAPVTITVTVSGGAASLT